MRQSSTKELQDKAQLSGKGDAVGIVQDIKICPYY